MVSLYMRSTKNDKNLISVSGFLKGEKEEKKKKDVEKEEKEKKE